MDTERPDDQRPHYPWRRADRRQDWSARDYLSYIANDSTQTYSLEEVMQEAGITQAELDAIPDEEE